jgi:DNA-binding response OmpR family regulator
LRLLLVEDDEHVSGPLVRILTAHGFSVRPAATGQEALDALLPGSSGHETFDVVLLDLHLPDMDGFEIYGRIRDRIPTPVIMVTAKGDVRSRIHGLDLGADDYVVKPYDPRELVARIHAVSRRSGTDRDSAPAPAATSGAETGAHAATQPLRVGPVDLDPASRIVTVAGRPVTLTRKEFDLLALLARSPGVVFRREQIISAVWRTNWEGTARTLEVHVASLRGKLGRPELIETVRGVGYRLAP